MLVCQPTFFIEAPVQKGEKYVVATTRQKLVEQNRSNDAQCGHGMQLQLLELWHGPVSRVSGEIDRFEKGK